MRVSVMSHRALFFALSVSALCLNACSSSSPAEDRATPPKDAALSAPADAQPQTAPPKAEAATAAPSAPARPPEPKLEDSPVMDLIHNGHRWHLLNPGLVIPFAQPGFWKYTQEYRRPFGEAAVEHQGMSGRTLSQSEATLSIPWFGDDSAKALNLTMHGLSANQGVRLWLNGAPIGSAKVTDKWEVATFKLPAGALKRGENVLVMRLNQRGKAGGQTSWGLFHALEIGDEPPAQEAAPAALLSPLKRAGEEGALTGYAGYSMWLEVPKRAWLSFGLKGAAPADAKVEVAAYLADGQRQSLWSGAPSADGASARVSLDALQGKLIRLQITAPPQVEITAPKVRLEVGAPPRKAIKPVKHAILLVVDALRADRLKLYGQTRVETPRMTKAGAGAVVYLHNQASAPSSPPSHGSIQTGMIPRVHGVTGDKGKLIAGTPLLSAQLVDAGVSTAYVGNNPFGMSRLKDASRWTTYIEPNRMGKGIDCSAVVSESLGFAKARVQAGERFFVSALPFEPHTPYRYHQGTSEKYHEGSWGPPVGKSVDGHLLGALSGGKKMTEAQWAQLKALYDGEVEHMDACFGQLVDGLAELGVLDETAIILTADHGEGMFEHGRMGHAYGHYAELSNVPFVVFMPGRVEGGPWQVEAVTANIDIAPTLLGLMGVKPSPQIQGQDVLPIALRPDGWTPRVVSMEYGKSYALRAHDYKLMVGYDGKEQLFDVSKDPTEQQDILGTAPFELRYMRDLTGFFLAYRTQWRMASWGSFGDHGPGLLEATGGLR